MNKHQLDNFINFCFNFHIEMDNSFLECNYEYIKEKWDKYILTEPVRDNIKLRSNAFNEWIDKWKVNERQSIDIKEILEFLCKLNERPLIGDNIFRASWTLSELIELFEEITGLKINMISNYRYNGLHQLIKNRVEYWLDREVNRREYKLNLLV